MESTPLLTKKSILTGAMIFIALIFLLEITSFFLLPSNSSTCHNCSRYSKNPPLNFWNPLSEKYTAKKTCSQKKLCFEEQYSFDSMGRRITGSQKSSQESPLFIMGDSFTLGYGLKDEDTISYQLQKNLNRPVYNYGHNGADLNLVLALFHSEKINMEMKKDSDAIVLLPQIMLYRNLPSTNYMHNLIWPHCRMIEQRWTCFKSGWIAYPLKSKFIYLFQKLKNLSSFLKLIDARMSFYSFNEHVKASGQLMLKIKDEYKRTFNGNIYFVEHPHSPFLPFEFKILKSMLGSDLIHLSMNQKEEDNLCDCDKHPNGIHNARLANSLSQHFSLKEALDKSKDRR